jgi:hypothetical protein
MSKTATSSSPHFPDKLRLRVPRGFGAALRLLAEQNNTLPSEWARQALLRSMRDEGVRILDGQARRVA